MKIKELLGMVAVDANANDIGKIIDVDFNPSTAKITNLTISLKKSFLSNEKFEVDFDDVKSIGDYVLLNTIVNNLNDSIENEDSSEIIIETLDAEVVDESKE